MIQHILVPLDGSALAETSLLHAGAMARAFDTEITVLRVQETNAKRTGGLADSLASRLARAECGSYVEAVAKRLGAQGLRAEGVATEGDPAEEILRLARERSADLLVLCAHGRGGISPGLGATALKVLARSHGSVLLKRAAEPANGRTEEVRYRRIMVPLDGSQRAHWALLQAVPLAHAHGGELLLVHVVAAPPFARRTPPSLDEISLTRQLAERDRRFAERYLDEMREMLTSGGLPVRTLLLESAHVVQTLERVAQEEEIALVVVSAHGCSGTAPWPYGSVADRLIHHGATPLLVLQDATAEQRADEAASAARAQPMPVAAA
jgi:nucleotide-binding universal stress UspA family protein